ncbi:MAG: RimK family protein [Deltaproteobacteria bacterium]|nr:RimK family protein [Deltaproteobacteria bacterium]
MKNLVVVERLHNWPLDVPGVRVVLARQYLTQPEFARERGLRVMNLCRSYRYQSVGYYVSLLAEARGHKVMPSISTIQDLKSATIIKLAGDDLDELIDKSLAPLQSDHFVLSVYFGRNVAKRYDHLAGKLFAKFRAPLLRAEFRRHETWELEHIKPIAASEIPEAHRPFVIAATKSHLERYPAPVRERPERFYDMAILWDTRDDSAPSDERAVKKFVKAAEALDFEVEIIGREDFDRIGEFDALFIRDTTNVNHYTFRFARRAAAEGLVVIDDPDSILRCTNKVYLAELLGRHKIPIPKTMIVSRDNLDAVVPTLGLPVVLKQPDSFYSFGVIKAKNEDELKSGSEKLLERSEFIVAQEFVPTPFDWRVTVLDGKPLFVCRYHMAGKHWQIVKRSQNGRTRYGPVDTIPVEDAPPLVVQTAVRAANLIGRGLYGVDLKELEKRCVVIEINDNPSIESGIEDAVLQDELYHLVMKHFRDRIERQRGAVVANGTGG